MNSISVHTSVGPSQSIELPRMSRRSSVSSEASIDRFLPAMDDSKYQTMQNHLRLAESLLTSKQVDGARRAYASAIAINPPVVRMVAIYCDSRGYTSLANEMLSVAEVKCPEVVCEARIECALAHWGAWQDSSDLHENDQAYQFARDAEQGIRGTFSWISFQAALDKYVFKKFGRDMTDLRAGKKSPFFHLTKIERAAWLRAVLAFPNAVKVDGYRSLMDATDYLLDDELTQAERNVVTEQMRPVVEALADGNQSVGNTSNHAKGLILDEARRCLRAIRQKCCA